MKKVAIVFVVAVILPSLALAWLAVRSLRDEQFLVERQESLLCQRATDSLAQNISEYLAQKQQEFNAQVESIVGNNDAREIGAQFDNEIRRRWSLADVGFCVTLSGRILSPSPNSRPEAQMFYYDNSGFLGNREAVEVYVNNNNNQVATTRGEPVSAWSGSTASSQQALETPAPPASAAATMSYGNTAKKESGATSYGQGQNTYNLKSAQARKVSPQQLAPQMEKKDTADDVVLSKTVAAEAEFAQLIGDSRDGMLARFLQNKLKLMFWHRLDRQPNLVFGAQLNLNQVVNGVRGLVRPDSGLANEICFALLDDNARPVAISIPNFSATWKRPFVATEVGDALPHWEVAAYVVNPVALNRAACYAEIALSLLIAVLVLAIVIGSWLIVRSLNAEL
ncbi:MAG TPA: hypothetical protein VN625_04445, partial [Desulfuromonadaceae bacterium]|nr:hypothetical protein [Desulfuromonadaceae bacterium]